jgi:hypothetical protein
MSGWDLEDCFEVMFVAYRGVRFVRRGMWPVSFHRQPPCCLFVSTPDYGVYVAVQQETPPPFILTELKWDRDPAPNENR